MPNQINANLASNRHESKLKPLKVILISRTRQQLAQVPPTQRKLYLNR